MKKRIIAWIFVVAFLLSVFRTSHPVFADSEYYMVADTIDTDQLTTEEEVVTENVTNQSEDTELEVEWSETTEIENAGEMTSNADEYTKETIEAEGEDEIVCSLWDIEQVKAEQKSIGIVFAQREWASGHFVWYVSNGDGRHYVFCLEKGKTMKSGMFNVSKYSGLFGTKANTFRIAYALDYFHSKGGWSSEEGYVDTQYAIWNQGSSDISKKIIEGASNLWKLTELNTSRQNGSSSYSAAVGAITQSQIDTATERKNLDVPLHKVYVDAEKENGYEINSTISINGSAWKYYANSNNTFSSGIEVMGCYDSEGKQISSEVANANVNSNGNLDIHIDWDENDTLARGDNPVTVIMRVNSNYEGTTKLDYLQTAYDEKTQTLSYSADFSSPAYFALKVYCDSDTIPTGIHMNKVDEFGNPVHDVTFAIQGRNDDGEIIPTYYFNAEDYIVIDKAGTYNIIEAAQPADLVRYEDPSTGNPNIAIIQVDEVIEGETIKLVATCIYKGENVTVSEDSLTYTVPNDYYDGSAYLKKVGNIFVTYDNGRFVYKKRDLENVQFELYAAENIYAGNMLLFEADQLITNEVLNNSVWNTVGQHNAHIDTHTGKDGYIHYNNLPVGHYYLVETETPYEGYWVAGSRITFEILAGKTVPVLAVDGLEEGEYMNNPVYADCLIKKESVQGEPLSNAEFTLYAHISNTNFDGYKLFTVEQTKPAVIARNNGIETVEENQWIPLETMSTNSNGEAYFEMTLPYGKYMVVETYPPHDTEKSYSLSNEVYQFEHTVKSSGNFASGALFTHTFTDVEKSNFILIKKTGEQLVDAMTINTQYGDYKELLFENMTVENVEFNIYNSDGDIIESLRTDKNGEAKSSNLNPGIYYVEEIKNNGTLKLDSSKKKVILENNETETIQIKEVEFYNEAVNTLLHIYKMTECASLSETLPSGVSSSNNIYQYTNHNVSDVVFGIFTREDIRNVQGVTIVKADSCVGYCVTDMDGIANFTNRLVNGNYYWRELQGVSNAHLLEDNVYDFTIQLKGEDVEVDLNSKDNPLINYMHKGSIKVIKTDGVSEQKLMGVAFTLYDAANNELGEFVTDENGEIYIEALPIGRYYLKETQTLQDYILDENKYTIDLSSGNLEQILTITNQKFEQSTENMEKKDTSVTKGKVKTGDDSRIVVFAAVLMVILFVFLGGIRLIRKDDEYETFKTND